MTKRLYGSAWRGALTGAVAGIAGLAASQLFGGIFRGSVSAINAVGGEFIDVVPAWLKQLAIDLFDTNDKLALKVGIWSVLLGISVIVGIVAQRGRMRIAYGIVAVMGLVGVAAVWARPGANLASIVAVVVGSLVTCAVLWWVIPTTVPTAPAPGAPAPGAPAPAAPAPAASAPGDDVTSDSTTAADAATPADIGAAEDVSVDLVSVDIPRRSFLQSVGMVGLGAVAMGGVGQFLTRRLSVSAERDGITLPSAGSEATSATVEDLSQWTIPGEPAAAAQPVTVLGEVAGPVDLGLEGVTPFVVPNSNFYRIDAALSVPQVSVDDWRLKVKGMVDNELELSYQDLLDRPQIERAITLSCVSNRIGDDLVGNAVWQGVRLADVLNEAGIQPGASQVFSRSVDGWTCGSPTAVIMDGRDAMLALGMNGEPLPVEHGYPVRLVVPGLYGYVSATKWLSEIELTRWEDADGYWVPRGWSKLGPIKTMARIDLPRAASGALPNDNGEIDIAGVAWAIHRGISKVEVSIDDGEWVECDLAGVPSDDTWRQWHYVWSDATPGDHTVAARAYDGNGEPQPLGPKDVAPDGAEGYHTITFRV